MQPSHAKQYERQADVYHRFARGGPEEDLAKTWTEDTTVDAWRHARMYETLRPILDSYPGCRWLTVGDGRYGCDAWFLTKQGMQALATDIGDTLLKEALTAGRISAFRKENAESLSFSDESFDFVLCKESLHHCPRPMAALYELVRVAKQGVVLIEPNDIYVSPTWGERATETCIAWSKRVLGKSPAVPLFEESGNYVYGLSNREVEKVGLALGLRHVAFKGFNDHYVAGVEQEQAAANGPLFRRVRRRIRQRDLLCRLRLRQYDLFTTIIFKGVVEPAIAYRLADQGYRVVELPKNPYSS
jgi:ubiquinone/menaquinone biosynthesis C-methylase UbiE